MPRKKRRHFTPEQKVSILREHLLDHTPISEVCETHNLQPSVFYEWQRRFFENGAAAFASDKERHRSKLGWSIGRKRPSANSLWIILSRATGA